MRRTPRQHSQIIRVISLLLIVVAETTEKGQEHYETGSSKKWPKTNKDLTQEKRQRNGLN
eukprot:CCRYP_020007-RA/>CCRYP_020007-RA protein AED:0.46 eAED:0.67 QI:108/0/0.5/1/0/0/2/0/59